MKKESSPKKKNPIMQKRKKENSMNSSMEICQNCLGTKRIFNGEGFKLCNICKGKGKVDENINSYFLSNITGEFFDTE